MNDYEKTIMVLLGIIAWFAFYGGCMYINEIYGINLFLLVVCGLSVIGAFVWLIYSLNKKHKDKINKRAGFIKKEYPNAYRAYEVDNIIQYKYFNESVASITDAEWEEREEQAKQLNHECSLIERKYHRGLKIWVKKQNISYSWIEGAKSKIKNAIIEAKDEIIRLDNKAINDEWAEEQGAFSSYCRGLRDELIPKFGCYSYDIKLPFEDNNTSVVVWQMFYSSYCLDKSLDYSIKDSFVRNAELVENHRYFECELGLKPTCEYIRRLNEEDDISVYINIRDGWHESIKIDIIETIKEILENVVPSERILIDPLPEIYNYGVKTEPTFAEWVKNIRRRVVVVDINTENKQLKDVCNRIVKKAKTKRPLLVYFSLFKCFSKEEMKEVLEKERKKLDEQKREEEARLEQIKKMTLDEIPIEGHKEQASGVDAEEYEKGIPVIETEEIRVDYELPKCGNCDMYCFYTAPDKYSIVFPYRKHRVQRRGYTEYKFENRLRQEFSKDDNYEILGDVSILVTEGSYPYEPDIAIIEKNNKYGIRIDIEIDEPYSGYENKPIHYKDCGDDFRDRTLADLGWMVIRFSESQIYKEPYNCINYIKQLINRIDNDVLPLPKGDIPQCVKRWSKNEAKEMIESQYRERLLNHVFGIQEIEEDKKTDSICLTLSEHEKQIAGKVEPIINESNEQNDSFKESKKELVINRTHIDQVVQLKTIKSNSVKKVSFVDLGLSVKWASCNLGAERPEDFGNYYAWAEIDTKNTYNWGSYKYLVGSTSVFTKYNNNDKFGDVDNRITLLPDDDVANVRLGGKCRIPTKREWLELMAECNWKKTSIDDIEGYIITSKKEGFEDRSIFLPAAGCCDTNYLTNSGINGYYWFSVLYENNPTLAYILRFDSKNVKWSLSSRRKGLSIRPVCP